MSPERFDHLVSLVRNNITKSHYIREPISPEERFAVTLRYLATGDSQHSLGFLFKLGRSTVNGIINEVCGNFGKHYRIMLNPKPRLMIGK